MNANGVPDTSNMMHDAEGVYHGNNWTYGPGGRYGRLTLTSGKWDFSNTKPADGTGSALSAVNCIVQINDGATVKDGTFNIVVNTGNSEQNIKGGTIAGGTFKSSVNNCGGTIKAGEFTHCVNDNLGDAKGTIEGGTFASNGTSDSVTNRGIISGGTFNGLVTSYRKGVIEKGTFNGKVSNYGSISGGYFLSADNKYDTDSKVSGGVFKTIPSKVESTSNLYKIQFDSESGAETTNTLSVDNHDFGMTSVYVVGTDDTELTVTAKDKILTSVNNKANTTANSNSITFKLGEVKLTDEKDGNAYLLKLNAKLYNSELKIGADGKPVTEGREPYGNGGVQGDGWTYINDTLTLSGTFEFAEDDYTQIDCSVVVGSGAKLSNAAVVGSDATVMNNGTITNCYFGNPSVTVINNGEISNSLFVKKPNGTGTLSGCLFASDEGLPKEHWTVNLNYLEDKTAYAGLQDNPFEMSVNKFYVIADASGTLPTIMLSENHYNGPLPAQVTVTAPDGAWWKQEINNNSLTIVQPTYKLTLVDAELVGMTGTEFTENATIKIKPKFDDEELELASWTSDTDKFNVNTITKNEDGTYTLKMPGDALTLTANSRKKTYSLTVVNGYIGDATDIRSGSFEKGAQITIVADAPANGFAFVGWNALNGTTCPVFSSADKDTRTYKFKMPAEKVELEAVYKLTGSGELVLVNGVPDINNAIRRDVHENVTTYFGRGWEYRVSDETDPSKNLLLLTGENFVLDKNSSSDSLKCNLEIGEYTSVKGTIPLTQAVKIEGAVDGMYFDGAKVTVDTIGRVTNSILHNVTVTNNDNIKNCVSDTKLPGAQELTEAGGATVTATLDGCEGEVSGTTLYFSGTPTLKVKVAGGIVEKANNKPVGKADANGWYTVTAAEDDDGIVLTKGEKTTPNPDDQPKTYTVTVKGGTINNETEVKAEKDIKLTVDVDEKEVPEGMTFDVWSIRFPKGIEDTLTPSVNLHDPHMTFTMPEADITIEAQYRSSELPGEDDGPSTLGTMATVAVGGAAAGILVWQGVSLGVDSYLQLNLPKGVAVPANRRELVVLLWETAGKPEAALPSLYSDVPAEEIELQKATRWAIDNGLVKPADDSDTSRFDPDRYVTKYDVFGAWLKLKKLMKL